MSRIGLIRNPASRRNLKGRASAPASVLIREPETVADVPAALAELRDAGVTLLAVDGGDGAVREVLTALRQVWPEPPSLAVISSGRTNVVAADVGVRGPRGTALARLQAAADAGRLLNRTRSPLSVDWREEDRGSLVGFVFGTAAYRRATELARPRTAGAGAKGGAAVAFTVAAAAAKSLIGAESDAWLSGEPVGLSIDEADCSSGARFLMAATTLERLTAGVWPFWSYGGSHLKYLDVGGRPQRLARALPGALRGRPRPWFDAAGYRSGGATTIDLRLQHPFVLDGELFDPGPDGRLRLTAGAPLTFVTP